MWGARQAPSPQAMELGPWGPVQGLVIPGVRHWSGLWGCFPLGGPLQTQQDWRDDPPGSSKGVKGHFPVALLSSRVGGAWLVNIQSTFPNAESRRRTGRQDARAPDRPPAKSRGHSWLLATSYLPTEPLSFQVSYNCFHCFPPSPPSLGLIN